MFEIISAWCLYWCFRRGDSQLQSSKFIYYLQFSPRDHFHPPPQILKTDRRRWFCELYIMCLHMSLHNIVFMACSHWWWTPDSITSLFNLAYLLIQELLRRLLDWILSSSSVYSPFSDRVGAFFTTGCPSWRQPHAWDAISNSSKYNILAWNQRIQLYKCVCTIPTQNSNINLRWKTAL